MFEDEFAELDMTEADFDQTWADGRPVVVIGQAPQPSGWACEHVVITGRFTDRPFMWCGCRMRPIFDLQTERL